MSGASVCVSACAILPFYVSVSFDALVVSILSCSSVYISALCRLFCVVLFIFRPIGRIVLFARKRTLCRLSLLAVSGVCGWFATADDGVCVLSGAELLR